MSERTASRCTSKSSWRPSTPTPGWTAAGSARRTAGHDRGRRSGPGRPALGPRPDGRPLAPSSAAASAPTSSPASSISLWTSSSRSSTSFVAASILYPFDYIDQGYYDFRHQLLRDASTAPCRLTAPPFPRTGGRVRHQPEASSVVHAARHYDRAGLRPQAFQASMTAASEASRISARHEAFELPSARSTTCRRTCRWASRPSCMSGTRIPRARSNATTRRRRLQTAPASST